MMDNEMLSLLAGTREIIVESDPIRPKCFTCGDTFRTPALLCDHVSPDVTHGKIMVAK